MRNLILVVIGLLFSGTSFADHYFKNGFRCEGYIKAWAQVGPILEVGDLVDVFPRGSITRTHLFLFGDLVEELQAKGLFPMTPYPGSVSPFGEYYKLAEYWNDTGHYGAKLRMDPYQWLHYYMKPGDTTLTLEVWTENHSKMLFHKVLKDCKKIQK